MAIYKREVREAWLPKTKTGIYKHLRLDNLETDPGQSTDLATRKLDVVKRMKADLLRINASDGNGHDWHLKE